MVDGEVFGTTDDGLPVHRFTISGGGLTAHIMNWGAVIQDLRLSGHDAPLVLGFDSFDDYPAHSPYMGAIAGRYANRIAGGRFTIDGQQYRRTGISSASTRCMAARRASASSPGKCCCTATIS